MITKLLIVNAAVLLVYMSAWFAVAYKLKRIDVVDAAWGSGFALVGWVSLILEPSGRSLVIAILTTLWSSRLTRHIAQRLRKKRDPRYEDSSSKWKGNFWRRAYLSIYLLQGALVWLISLPIMIAAGELRDVATIGFYATAGTIIWAIGAGFEAVADKQLHDFVADPANKGKVMDKGLWAYSRHPNYFGELVLWYGIAVFSFPSAHWYVAFIGPIVLSLTIIFVSGIPPIERRRKNDPAYQEYAKRVSPLVPLPKISH
ncbi:MAG: Steroid 5-alpha reductase family enzyme [Candidatus Saccharibacteria bacterium]|nr:Steroid 5-alpha reductase family enzyme [Candidatus Saccharibacteria bacterium]